MQNNLIEAVYISIIGVAFVFIFLIFLILASQLLAAIINRFTSKETLLDDSISPSTHQTKFSEQNKIAAISVAIHRHRKKIKLESV